PGAGRACGHGRGVSPAARRDMRSRTSPPGARAHRRRSVPSRRRRASLLDERRLRPERSARLLAAFGVGAVDRQHAVEVVVFVLHDARREAIEPVTEVVAARVLALEDAHPRRDVGVLADLRERLAPDVLALAFAAALCRLLVELGLFLVVLVVVLVFVVVGGQGRQVYAGKRARTQAASSGSRW